MVSLSSARFQRECFQFLPIQYDIGCSFVVIAFIILRWNFALVAQAGVQWHSHSSLLSGTPGLK